VLWVCKRIYGCGGGKPLTQIWAQAGDQKPEGIKDAVVAFDKWAEANL